MFVQEFIVQPGRTSYLADIFFQQVANLTEDAGDGTPIERGFVDMDFDETTLIARYHRQGAAAPVAITLATMTAGTWVSGGLVKYDDTNMPGMCQFGIPDAALAAGADYVDIVISVATALAATAFIRVHLRTPPPIVVRQRVRPNSQNLLVEIPLIQDGGGYITSLGTVTGYTAKYHRRGGGAAGVSAACATMTADTWVSNGLALITSISGGVGQFGVPNAALLPSAGTLGVRVVRFLIQNPVTCMIPVLLELELDPTAPG